MQKPLLNFTQPLVDENGVASLEFQSVLNRLTNDLVITGEGSPEGVVEALQWTRYVDTSASSGSIYYIKKETDVAGDKSQGWVII